MNSNINEVTCFLNLFSLKTEIFCKSSFKVAIRPLLEYQCPVKNFAYSYESEKKN